MVAFFATVAPLTLLLLGSGYAGDAVCDPRVSANTTNCACAEGDEGCSFPTCVDGCTCSGGGGGCIMNSCLINCICPAGGCIMELCINNCDNHGDVTPPLCVVAEGLDPSLRGELTPAEVCARDHIELNALTPYVCNDAAIYACCTADTESISNAAGMEFGTCNKDLEIITGAVGKNNDSHSIEGERYRFGDNIKSTGHPSQSSFQQKLYVSFISAILCMLLIL